MAIYNCSIIDNNGKNKKIKLEAVDEAELKAEAAGKGYVLLAYKIQVKKKRSDFFNVSFSVKRSELVIFFRQFSVMINASVSIADSLSTLCQQNYTSALKDILERVRNDVIGGRLLSESFAQRPDVFPDFFIQMVKIGELSGSLDKILFAMAEYYENDEKTKKKAKSSLVYPIFLLVMIFAVVLFMSFVILPQFADMFAEFGGDVPGVTKFVLGIAEFIRNYILYIISGTVVFALAIYLLTKSLVGKRVKDFLAIKFPIIGKINNAVITSRFARAFCILLKSGMNISDCMSNLVKILGNQFYIEKFEIATEEVNRGRPIAKSLEDCKVFNPMLVEMIRVGEKTGNIEEVLDSTSSFFDAQVDNSITKAISLIEPITIIILGVVVAFVLLSVYIPMIDLMNQI